MGVTLLLLLIAGPVGGVDVIYFHIWKFKLYRRRNSVKEELTHLCRAVLFPVGVGILLSGRPAGLWFWLMFGLFAFDAANSLLDVLSEPASRAPLVVPPAELAVHFLGTTLMGAAWATFMLSGWADRHRPTELLPYPVDLMPDWVFAAGWGSAAASVALLVVETFLFIRAVLRRRGAATTLTEAV